MFPGMGGMPGMGGVDPAMMAAQQQAQPKPDTQETVVISGLALLKMLKHGRSGVPMEVMGLMLGEFVDDYTIHVTDVFSMPQSGTGVSVEAVDHAYQQEMIDMLAQTNRSEKAVGWYHSHPGFGCWFSQTDINTQMSFERLDPRAIGVVIDPIQSVRGKVVIDCFRCISQQVAMLGQEARQTTGLVGKLKQPSIQALVHGLGKQYYSLNISFRKDELQESMLMNLHKQRWVKSLNLDSFEEKKEQNKDIMKDVASMCKEYVEKVQKEEKKDTEDVQMSYVGKIDPKVRLESSAQELLADSIVQNVGSMVHNVIF
eukprot:TRINITY_DN3831_c0_g1_i1.p1 TRINITY_DN3831_c0_g1~~TRINITY_DN3831_c0_g1_i1.p1  ORF type:complete len:314 (-),score=106.89 TRINITY_DN3831_c0_g1_i1:137-1078(-)